MAQGHVEGSWWKEIFITWLTICSAELLIFFLKISFPGNKQPF